MSNLIYIYHAGQFDRARWLQLDIRPDGQVLFLLQDLCHPGRLSHLRHITCPADLLETTLTGGALQLSGATGYLLLRSEGDLLALEFRGLDDGVITKVTVLHEQVRDRVQSLLGSAGQANFS